MVTHPLPPRPGDLVGRRIGGYTIEALIGEGGMGAVYAAINPRLGRRAAIKVISGEYTQSSGALDRFFREAKAVAAVDDPNIIDIYDAAQFAEDGLTYILMPFIQGKSLEDLCEELGPLPLPTAGIITLQIASGLDAVHAVGIVHRDIKPANVLVSRRQQRRYFVTIVDFGIAKLLDPVLAEGFRTRTRSVVGTAGYMAPEQARGDRDVDGRADVYSLATLLFRLLTGRRPYTEGSLYALIEKQVRSAPFPRPRELRPDVPPGWEDLILQALHVDRARRPASMKEFAQRLAASMPDGDVLLRLLAPRLGAEAPLAPDERTLAGDLEVSITRWASAKSQPPRHSRRTLVAVTAAVVATMTAGAYGLHELFPRKIERIPSPPTVVIAAMPVVLPVPAAAPPAGSGAPATPPLATLPHAAAPHPHGDGSLVVKVKPYAEVTIDGEPAGTSPLRRALPAGVHHVVLVGPDQREEVTVTVAPGRESTIQRSW